MISKIEVIIDVIVHATEDISKIFQSFEEMLELKEEDFTIQETEERTVDSRFHMRLNKQELIKGNLRVSEKDTIKIKIHTPVYNKKDTVKLFTEIFEIAN